MVDFTTEPSHVALSVTLLVFVCAFANPILSYCIYLLKINWNERYISKRHPWILTGLLVSAALTTLIELPFNALARIAESVPWSGDNFQYIELLGWECRVIFCSLIAVRVYLLAYDQEYSRVLCARKWQVMIDPSVRLNWFLKNRNRWGSPMFIFQCILLPIWILLIVYFILTSVMLEQLSEAGVGVFGFSALVTAFISLFYWRTLPKRRDVLFLRDELRISVPMFYIGCTVVMSLLIIHELEVKDDDVMAPVIELLVCILWTLVIPLVMIVTLMYPQWKMKHDTAAEQLILDAQTDDGTTSKWETIIETSDGYEQYAVFLEKELSVENLLFVSEYVQLKNGLLEIEDLKEMIELKELWFTITLPDTAPQIKRVRSQSADKKVDRRIKQRGFVKSAKDLYRKYLLRSVAFMKVSISKALEKELSMAFDSLDQTLQPFELVLPLFERTAIEVSEELKDTFSRFRTTDVFQKLEKARVTGIPASFPDETPKRIL